MVQGGLGVAFLPSEEFRHRAIEGIVELKIREPIIKEVGICWRRDNASPLVDAVVAFAKDWVGK
jgi:DNA-binding transcriptional LysR family regulator